MGDILQGADNLHWKHSSHGKRTFLLRVEFPELAFRQRLASLIRDNAICSISLVSEISGRGLIPSLLIKGLLSAAYGCRCGHR